MFEISRGNYCCRARSTTAPSKRREIPKPAGRLSRVIRRRLPASALARRQPPFAINHRRFRQQGPSRQKWYRSVTSHALHFVNFTFNWNVNNSHCAAWPYNYSIKYFIKIWKWIRKFSGKIYIIYYDDSNNNSLFHGNHTINTLSFSFSIPWKKSLCHA